MILLLMKLDIENTYNWNASLREMVLILGSLHLRMLELQAKDHRD